ncbi:hypothetical protein N7490_002159 [Penicillium lividum]|nr:hypothetical protein N7490_002159 [Penicillium lividum]
MAVSIEVAHGNAKRKGSHSVCCLCRKDSSSSADIIDIVGGHDIEMTIPSEITNCNAIRLVTYAGYGLCLESTISIPE